MTRFSSIFSQLLQLFPRTEFEQAVKKHNAERGAKGFTCWGQFVAMMFCQLGRAHSLREICGGLASCEGKLKHLGISEAPKKSTLAYANQHRPWELYQTLFGQVLGKCQSMAQSSGLRKKFRFKNKLASLDASTIDLCLSMYDWGKVPADKGSREAAPAAGSRRLSAQLRGDHRRQEKRHHGRADDKVRTGDGAGDRPRLQRLRLVWGTHP